MWEVWEPEALWIAVLRRTSSWWSIGRIIEIGYLDRRWVDLMEGNEGGVAVQFDTKRGRSILSFTVDDAYVFDIALNSAGTELYVFAVWKPLRSSVSRLYFVRWVWR
jgi:hypothetical protein